MLKQTTTSWPESHQQWFNICASFDHQCLLALKKINNKIHHHCESYWIHIRIRDNKSSKSLKTNIFQTTKHIYSEWERNIFQRIKQIFLGHESKYIPDKKAKIFQGGKLDTNNFYFCSPTILEEPPFAFILDISRVIQFKYMYDLYIFVRICILFEYMHVDYICIL